MANSHESLARSRKVDACVRYLDAVSVLHGLCPLTQPDRVADALRNLSERGWSELAEHAGTRKLSAESRRQLIVTYERRHDSMRAARVA